MTDDFQVHLQDMVDQTELGNMIFLNAEMRDEANAASQHNLMIAEQCEFNIKVLRERLDEVRSGAVQDVIDGSHTDGDADCGSHADRALSDDAAVSRLRASEAAVGTPVMEVSNVDTTDGTADLR